MFNKCIPEWGPCHSPTKSGVYFSPLEHGWTCDCSDQQSRIEMMFCDCQGHLIERIQLLPGSLFLECMLWGTQKAHLRKSKLGHLERYMWRGTGIFLANSQQQVPDIWINEPSNDFSSQPLSFLASDSVEQKKPCLLCPVQISDPQNLWA